MTAHLLLIACLTISVSTFQPPAGGGPTGDAHSAPAWALGPGGVAARDGGERPLAPLYQSAPSETSASAPSTPGVVTSTLVLHNGTLWTGNRVPENASSPGSLAVAPNGSEVFVGTNGGAIAEINTTRHTLDAVVPTGGAVWDLTFDPNGSHLYGVHPSNDSVFVLDPKRLVITSTIGVGKAPSGIAFDTRNGEIYVANEKSDNVSVIDAATDRVITSIPVGSSPDHVLVGGPNGYVFVSNSGSDDVAVIDGSTNSVVGWPLTGSDPGGMAYDPFNGLVYVANGLANSLSVLDSYGNNFGWFPNVGGCPWDVIFDSSARLLFVSDTTCQPSLGSVSVVDPGNGSVARHLEVGAWPLALAYVARTDEIYTANEDATDVTILDATAERVVYTIGVDASPSAVVYDPFTKHIYVANSGTNNVSVLDGTTEMILASIRVGQGPDGMAYDPANHCLYVANFASDDVSVVNDSSDRVVATIPVGVGPVGVAYDSAIGYVYVANSLSNNVSAIYAADNLVVGSLHSTTRPWAVTYDPLDAKVFVADVGPSVAYEGVSDNVTVIDGVADRVAAVVPVGETPIGVAFDPGNDEVYVANAFSLNLSIVGGRTDAPLSSVHLSTLGLFSMLYGVRLDALNGEVWVAVAGDPSIRNSNEFIVLDGATNRVLGSLTPGVLPCDIAFDGSNGLGFAVNQLSGTVSVIRPSVYPPDEFNVTLVASGLPPGWPWSATLGSAENASGSSSMGFSMVDGTYGYKVGYVPGYVPENRSGSVSVRNASVVVSIPFVPFESSVRVSESGLPLGIPWSVQWDGITTAGSSPTLELSAPNGTYPLVVGPVESYSPSVGAQWVVVRGAPVSVSIRFTYAAPPGPGPSIPYFNATPGTLGLGENVSFGVMVAGGTAPLAYAYTGLPPGCLQQNSPLLDCRPASVGHFTVTATVRDALNRTANASASISVTGVDLRGGGPPPDSILSAWLQPWGLALLVGVGVAAVVVGLRLHDRRRGVPLSRKPPGGPPRTARGLVHGTGAAASGTPRIPSGHGGPGIGEGPSRRPDRPPGRSPGARPKRPTAPRSRRASIGAQPMTVRSSIVRRRTPLGVGGSSTGHRASDDPRRAKPS